MWVWEDESFEILKKAQWASGAEEDEELEEKEEEEEDTSIFRISRSYQRVSRGLKKGAV